MILMSLLKKPSQAFDHQWQSHEHIADRDGQHERIAQNLPELPQRKTRKTEHEAWQEHATDRHSRREHHESKAQQPVELRTRGVAKRNRRDRENAKGRDAFRHDPERGGEQLSQRQKHAQHRLAAGELLEKNSERDGKNQHARDVSRRQRGKNIRRQKGSDQTLLCGQSQSLGIKKRRGHERREHLRQKHHRDTGDQNHPSQRDTAALKQLNQ